MKNETIAMAWVDGETAKSKNLTTDGTKLWSYNLLIGEKDDWGNPVIWNYTKQGGNFVSQTTSKHVGWAVTAASRLHTSLAIRRPDDN